MTHNELVTEFLNQGLRKGDLVQIELTNQQVISGYLSDSRVHATEDENGNIIESRIGLLPPPAPPGHINPRTITPIFSANIVTISHLE